MCIRDSRLLRTTKNRFGSTNELGIYEMQGEGLKEVTNPSEILITNRDNPCLLYTSDAADERSSVDLGGRRIIKKKNK